MENTGTLLCVAFVILIFGMIGYDVYDKKRIKQSKEDIESFLSSLSRSFHDAKWTHLYLHTKGERTNEEIAHIINEKLTTEIEHEFNALFPRLYLFPSTSFRIFSGDPTTNDFSVKICPVLRALYQRYTYYHTPVTTLHTEFCKKTKEIILLELEKESSNSDSKQWLKILASDVLSGDFFKFCNKKNSIRRLSSYGITIFSPWVLPKVFLALY